MFTLLMILSRFAVSFKVTNWEKHFNLTRSRYWKRNRSGVKGILMKPFNLSLPVLYFQYILIKNLTNKNSWIQLHFRVKFDWNFWRILLSFAKFGREWMEYWWSHSTFPIHIDYKHWLIKIACCFRRNSDRNDLRIKFSSEKFQKSWKNAN